MMESYMGRKSYLLWRLLGASRQELALPTINRGYGNKDVVGRIRLLNDGRAEFPLIPYGPSLGRAGEAPPCMMHIPSLVVAHMHLHSDEKHIKSLGDSCGFVFSLSAGPYMSGN
jgi:hypothetical protein